MQRIDEVWPGSVRDYKRVLGIIVLCLHISSMHNEVLIAE